MPLRHASHLSVSAATAAITCTGDRAPAVLGQAQPSDSRQRPTLPPEVQRARDLRRTGLTLSVGAIAAAGAAAVAGGVQIHPPEWLPAAVSAPPAAAAAGLLGAKAALGDELWAEWHGGRLHVERIPRRTGGRIRPGDVVVQPTGDGRGNGAFAIGHLPEGTCLGDYEGDVLDEAQYWQRYPSGVSDYSIHVGERIVIDGRDRAKDTAVFSPCHMNHSSGRANVGRHTQRRAGRVTFYTIRPVEAGDELLLDYGRLYWKGRGHLLQA